VNPSELLAADSPNRLAIAKAARKIPAANPVRERIAIAKSEFLLWPACLHLAIRGITNRSSANGAGRYWNPIVRLAQVTDTFSEGEDWR
jgi:hypothetical protein